MRGEKKIYSLDQHRELKKKKNSPGALSEKKVYAGFETGIENDFYFLMTAEEIVLGSLLV